MLVGNGDKAGGAEGGGAAPCCGRGRGRSEDTEGVRRAGGGLFPLNSTVASLGPDAVHVVHPGQHLAVAVAQDTSGDSSEVLGAVCGGSGVRKVG